MHCCQLLDLANRFRLETSVNMPDNLNLDDLPLEILRIVLHEIRSFNDIRLVNSKLERLIGFLVTSIRPAEDSVEHTYDHLPRGLVNLQYLVLPPGVTHLKTKFPSTLRGITFNDVFLCTVCGEIAHLSQLSSLTFKNCKGGLTPLNCLTSLPLAHLSLDIRLLSIKSPLDSFTSLTSLHLKGHMFTDHDNTLSRLTNLQELHIDVGNAITPITSSMFSPLVRLERLCLPRLIGRRVRMLNLDELPRGLQALTATSFNLTGLHALTVLTALRIDSKSLWGGGLQVSTVMPGLQHLRVIGTPPGDHLEHTLSAATQLTCLHVHVPLRPEERANLRPGCSLNVRVSDKLEFHHNLSLGPHPCARKCWDNAVTSLINAGLLDLRNRDTRNLVPTGQLMQMLQKEFGRLPATGPKALHKAFMMCEYTADGRFNRCLIRQLGLSCTHRCCHCL